MIYCYFFKDAAKINIKEKKKTHLEKPHREMICPVS